MIQGGGKVNGAASVTVDSSINGYVEAALSLGLDAGPNVIEAILPGPAGSRVTFLATGVARDPAKATSFTGVVLDNTSNPLGGATCRLDVASQSFTTTSDTKGQFRSDNTPAGPAHLAVDGLTATTLGGNPVPPNTFPPLAYALTLVPNAENSLPTPVLLPCMNVNNARTYDGATDLVLACEGIAGFKMTIKAGSMRKPDGTLVTPQNPAVVSLNQVHFDQIPMPMPDGNYPPFAWTLQPGGSTFNPPIPVEFPNMTGLAPGAVSAFLSFNHDTERFEIVANAHVTANGALIVSDPGEGLALAGWGGPRLPPPATGNAGGDGKGGCYPPFIGPCNQGEYYTSCGCLPAHPPGSMGTPPNPSGDCDRGHSLYPDGLCWPNPKIDADGDGVPRAYASKI